MCRLASHDKGRTFPADEAGVNYDAMYAPGSVKTPPLPPAGCGQDRSGIGLEEPATEAVVGPRRECRHPKCAPYPARWRIAWMSTRDMRWSANNAARTSASYAAAARAGSVGPAWLDRARRENAGAQRLRDALAGERIGRACRVAREQHAPARRASSRRPARGSARRGAWLQVARGAEHRADVRSRQQVRPCVLHRAARDRCAPVGAARIVGCRTRRSPVRRRAGTTTRSRAGGRARTRPRAVGHPVRRR